MDGFHLSALSRSVLAPIPKKMVAALLVAATALASTRVTQADAMPKVAQPARPTCDATEHRQFDFWLGDWMVTEGGQPAGRNEIRIDLSGCALFESWTAMDHSRGRSMSFYDRARRRWHQTWVDDRGGVLELDGAWSDGHMVLSQESGEPTARTVNRITWTPNPDGSVRQHWEVRKGRAAGWETVFDGLYRRAP